MTADVIYLDFIKAFDIPHKSAFIMLQASDIVAQVLTDRFGRADDKASMMDWLPCLVASLSSVLGPSLFVMYIRDLEENSQSPCVMHAEYPKVQCSRW